MYCENCGKAMPENSPACGYCGQLFTTQAAAAAAGAGASGSGVSRGYASPYAGHYGSGTQSVGSGQPSGTGHAPGQYSSPNHYGSSYQAPGPGAPTPSGMGPVRKPKMNPLLVLPVFRWLLGALENGKVIRTGVALVLRILAGAIVLGGVILLVGTLKMAFDLPGAATLGGIVAAALVGATSFAMFQILLYRAKSVSNLGDSEFSVMPIFSYLFRATGECYAAFSVGMGVTGCIFAWFTGISPTRILPVLPGVPGIGPQNSFVFGLAFLGLMLLLAFLVLVSFYFCAELVLVMADISRNVGPDREGADGRGDAAVRQGLELHSTGKSMDTG